MVRRILLGGGLNTSCMPYDEWLGEVVQVDDDFEGLVIVDCTAKKVVSIKNSNNRLSEILFTTKFVVGTTNVQYGASDYLAQISSNIVGLRQAIGYIKPYSGQRTSYMTNPSTSDSVWYRELYLLSKPDEALQLVYRERADVYYNEGLIIKAETAYHPKIGKFMDWAEANEIDLNFYS